MVFSVQCSALKRLDCEAGLAAGSCDKETSVVLFYIGLILPSFLAEPLQTLPKYRLSTSLLQNKPNLLIITEITKYFFQNILRDNTKHAKRQNMSF